MRILRKPNQLEWKNKSKVFLQIINRLCYVQSLQRIADQSGVTYATLWNWINGNTLSPNTRTLFAVANTLGFEVVLMKATKRNHLTLVGKKN